MPLNKLVAGLSLDDVGGETSRPGSAAPSAPALGKQGSFDISGTDTFNATDIKIKGGSGLANKPEASDGVVLSDLIREKPLGRGATGRVVLMKHRQTGELFALKELDALASHDARHQASNELRIAHKHATLCDNLVSLKDAYFVDGKICILMEFCDGGSLADAFEHARANPPSNPSKGLPLGALILQLCHGLRYMHNEMNQVHRDLKPANALLTGTGVLKLSDFGISKQLDSTGALAMTQVGSTAYMSPERLQGDEYGFASDVWSVGVIALESLLGEHPFPASKYKSFMSLFGAVTKGELPKPPEGTPEPLCTFLLQCLRVKPSERPPVEDLISKGWLASVGEPRQPVMQWLMKAAAKRLAQKIIDA